MHQHCDCIRNLTTNKVFSTASVRSTSTVSLELLKYCVSKLPIDKWIPKRKSRRGRKGFSPKCLFMTYLLKLKENIPHDTKLAQKLQENETYKKFCCFSKCNTPSHDTISRFNRELTGKRLRTILRKLDELLTKEGIFDRDELAVDATIYCQIHEINIIVIPKLDMDIKRMENDFMVIGSFIWQERRVRW